MIEFMSWGLVSQLRRNGTIKMSWDESIERVTPYIVKIEAPRGHGTGFSAFTTKTRAFEKVCAPFLLEPSAAFNSIPAEYFAPCE